MKFQKKRGFSAISIALTFLLSACASSPDKIQSAYVSPIQYQNHDCGQIAGEMERVTRRTQNLQASLQKKADDDSAQMAVGMILFWPALFFLEGGDGPEAAEYGRLKGERDALERLAVQKRCAVNDLTAVPASSATPVTEAAIRQGAGN